MASSLTAQAGPVPYNFMESAVVTMFGADKTGVANSSAAFIAAANALTSGGVVVIPPGKYIVEGLPIRDGLYYVGAGVGKTDGSTGTYLALPAVPSTHMFVWDGAATGFGGGMSGCMMP